MKKWTDIFPVEVYNDLIVGPDGFTVGFKVELMEAYTVSREKKEQVYERLWSLLRSLPINSKVFKQDFFYKSTFEVDFNSDDSVSIYKNKLTYDEMPLMANHSNIYFTFPLQGLTQKSVTDYLFKRPLKNIEREVETQMGNINSLVNSLKGWDGLLTFERMSSADLLKSVAQYFNLDYSNPEKEIQVLNDLHFEKSTKNLQVGSEFIKIISLVEESNLNYYKVPKLVPNLDKSIDLDSSIQIKETFMFPLSVGLPFDHIISTFIKIEDPAKIKKELVGKKVRLNAIRMFSLEAVQQQEYIEMFQSHLVENNVTPVKMGMNILIHSKEMSKLSQYEDLVKKAFEQLNQSTGLTENYGLFKAYMNNCPGNNAAFGHLIYSDHARAAVYLNLSQNYKNDNKGFVLLDRLGAPKLVNLRNTKLTNSFHGICFAPTGGGKSFLMHWYIDNCLSIGEHVVLINTKDDYKKIGEFFKELGKNVSYVDTSEVKVGIDLFFYKYSDGSYLYDEEHILMIIDILCLVWKNDNDVLPVERSILGDVIKAFYKECNKNEKRPIFVDFIDFIDVFSADIVVNKDYQNTSGVLMFDFNEFKLILKPLVSFFTEDNTIDISNSDLTIFDLSGVLPEKVGETIFKVYLNYTFYIGTKKVNLNQTTGTFTNLLVDECIDSMNGKGGEIIGRAFRTYRSKNASVLLTTQDVKYLNGLTSVVKDSIFGNLAMVFLLDHSRNTGSIPVLQSTLSLSDFGIELLNSIKNKESDTYRSFYLKFGAIEKVYRLQVSSFTSALFTTDSKSVREIYRLKKEGDTTLTEAINKYVELQKK